MIRKYFSSKRLLRLLFSKNISRFALIDSKSQISKNSKINRFVKIIKSSIDDYSYVGPSSVLTNCEVGKFCSISNYVLVGPSLHPINHISTSPIFYSPQNGTGTQWTHKATYDDFPPRTYIANDVWIGLNVIIMGGLKIGNGAIIAANAVVTKDIPPYSIVAGMPAKIIKYRFDDKTIERFENLDWWNYPDDFLKENLEILSKPLTKDTLDMLEQYSL